ncbi:hypothetical protein [Eleftheria terrae]|uniref:hypothetical protein n=1 Tax=Eleftheria terrae TaxID=1597781 RepID=UPI00263AFB50|nr:hypothetical protein [Eleftheria terrae]WKB54338.1 hypothetical protein N7L95_08110 [Eleftheria terrae]
MWLSKKELRSLEPVRGRLDEPVELPVAYARRVQRLLPNFPDSVILQWFYEHGGVIEQHAGLNFPSLRFRLTTFEVKELELPCLAEHPTVVQYRDYFLQGVESRRMKRLAQFIQQQGTWPVPPLVFDNADGGFVASWGFRYSRPFDVLEGHHRMAVLYALGMHRRGSHEVWLVQH